MNKKYSTEVWDVQFYKVDENGDELLNDDGSVKLFRNPGVSWQDCIAIEDDDLEDADLVEVES